MTPKSNGLLFCSPLGNVRNMLELFSKDLCLLTKIPPVILDECFAYMCKVCTMYDFTEK